MEMPSRPNISQYVRTPVRTFLIFYALVWNAIKCGSPHPLLLTCMWALAVPDCAPPDSHCCCCCCCVMRYVSCVKVKALMFVVLLIVLLKYLQTYR
jgi:hypothetical protein